MLLSECVRNDTSSSPLARCLFADSLEVFRLLDAAIEVQCGSQLNSAVLMSSVKGKLSQSAVTTGVGSGRPSMAQTTTVFSERVSSSSAAAATAPAATLALNSVGDGASVGGR